MEVLNLTEKLNMTGIVTLNHLETDEDLADLVDYMFGSDDGNPWVQQRHEDGHPEPFNFDKYFELGNEVSVPSCSVC
jgi:alpha-L-arabinofuranosidase